MEITLNILPAILITNSLLSTTVYHRRKRGESTLQKDITLAYSRIWCSPAKNVLQTFQKIVIFWKKRKPSYVISL